MVELLLALLTTMTGLERTVDADLTAIAQRRAVEISSCPDVMDADGVLVAGPCFSHDGWVYGRDGEAEILARNFDPDPVTRLALQWQGSPAHWAILVDPKYDRWGCAISQAGDATYGVCLFRSAASIALAEPIPIAPAPPVEPAPTPPILLPNTATEVPMTPRNVAPSHPIEGQHVVFAADQPEYQPLPVWRKPGGAVISRWQLTWRERMAALFGRDLYIEVLTFDQPLQPIYMGFSEEDVLYPQESEAVPA